MTIRRRHQSRRTEGLTREEHDVLRYGTTMGLSPSSLTRIDPVDGLVIDRDAARAAWPAHRDELMAECAREFAEGGRPTLIPWAAREFDGLVGQVNPYSHLPGWTRRDDGPGAA